MAWSSFPSGAVEPVLGFQADAAPNLPSSPAEMIWNVLAFMNLVGLSRYGSTGVPPPVLMEGQSLGVTR